MPRSFYKIKESSEKNMSTSLERSDFGKMRYLLHPRIVLFAWGIRGHFRFMDDERYLKLMYWAKFGIKLNLGNPQSYNEKIQWLKLNEKNPICEKLVDKYEAKRYVADLIGEEYIIPTLGVWDTFDKVDINLLPDEGFVLKTTHDSGGVYICKNKAEYDSDMARRVIEKSLKRNYYWIGREWPYKNVRPRIIAEPLLVDESGVELKDYKIFNFHGEAKLIQVDYDRFISHKRNLYDTEWNYINAEIKYPTSNRVIDKPVCLNKLLKLSEKLSQGFIHARTDFYVIGERIFFGEITFLHGSGYECFRPASFGSTVGKWMKLDK